MSEVHKSNKRKVILNMGDKTKSNELQEFERGDDGDSNDVKFSLCIWIVFAGSELKVT